jgi:hypothetical protein
MCRLLCLPPYVWRKSPVPVTGDRANKVVSSSSHTHKSDTPQYSRPIRLAACADD